MTAKQMMQCYPYKTIRPTFEEMYARSCAMHRIDPISVKWLPFLEDGIIETTEAYCIFEQCIAIEKGWAK